MFCDSGFRNLLDKADFGFLDDDPATAYGLFPDLTLAYANKAWDKFARANGGADALKRWRRDSSVLTAISGPSREFYSMMFALVMKDGRPLAFTYDCSSAHKERVFEMQMIPLGKQGLLTVHSLVAQWARPAQGNAHLADYLNSCGILTQCSHCRRVRRVDSPRRWDWVPQLIEKPFLLTSHGLCRLCKAQLYGTTSTLRRKPVTRRKSGRN